MLQPVLPRIEVLLLLLERVHLLLEQLLPLLLSKLFAVEADKLALKLLQLLLGLFLKQLLFRNVQLAGFLG